MYNQLGPGGVIIAADEPVGPNQSRIKEIIRNAIPGQYRLKVINEKKQPYEYEIYDNGEKINILICTWRISNGGRANRVDEKRIQIGKYHNNNIFTRRNTKTEKNLLLGIYESIQGSPIIVAWDVDSNNDHGKNKSCFTDIETICKAYNNSYVEAEDSDGNKVVAFTKEKLIDYILDLGMVNKGIIHRKIIGKSELPQTSNDANKIGISIMNNNSSTKKSEKSKTEFFLEIIEENQKLEKTVEDIKRKLLDSDFQAEDVERLVKGRIGQNVFRDLLLAKYQKGCCICGIKNKKILIASHIKAWNTCNSKEKTDENNGLLLCCNHDALFDKHLISFDNDGTILISDELGENDLFRLGLSTIFKLDINDKMLPYIKEHRKIFYSKAKVIIKK